jgi:hypothetical protein
MKAVDLLCVVCVCCVCVCVCVCVCTNNRQLHLHVVSEDFDSRCMNRELRWNSFTTPFFIPSTGNTTLPCFLLCTIRDGTTQG